MRVKLYFVLRTCRCITREYAKNVEGFSLVSRALATKHESRSFHSLIRVAAFYTIFQHESLPEYAHVVLLGEWKIGRALVAAAAAKAAATTLRDSCVV
jgi:hypothetical protein